MYSPGIGITLSHTHLRHLGLSIDESLSYAFQFSFSHMRLGCYWSTVESKKDEYDFSQLQAILNRCEKNRQRIIMNIGMKSPRWPEFYFPEYLSKERNTNSEETQKRGIIFLEKCISTLQKYNCITHWQVENEPLDPSGPHNDTIPFRVLQDEVFLVRKLDKRPIILTLWGNDLKSRNLLPFIIPLADVIGLDLYYKQHLTTLFGKNVYLGPRSNDDYLKQVIRDSSKPVILTELQAEPWEKNHESYLSDSPPSISPGLLKQNMLKAKELGIREILLWGFEYWYYQMVRGNKGYMDVVREFTLHFNKYPPSTMI